jgi:hypothetical protein
LKNTLFGRNLR